MPSHSADVATPFSDIYNLSDGSDRKAACTQYGASNILAYITAARDERESRPEDIWLSATPVDSSQCYSDQGLTLDTRIEEGLRTLIDVNARVRDELKARRKAEGGEAYSDSSSDDGPPSLESFDEDNFFV